MANIRKSVRIDTSCSGGFFADKFKKVKFALKWVLVTPFGEMLE